MTKESSVIDYQRLNFGPPDLVNELIKMLLQQLPEAQRTIRVAIENKDWIEARNQLHKLHGSCAYCGLLQLGPAVSELHNAIKNQKPPYDKYLTNVDKEIKAVMDELQNEKT